MLIRGFNKVSFVFLLLVCCSKMAVGNISIKHNFISQQASYVSDPDIDSDGIPNEWETQHGLDPNNSADATQDPDADGLTNLQEYLSQTNPHNPDSDGDLISDKYEVDHNLNPLSAADANQDADNDGLTNLQEYNLSTNAQSIDTDADGMDDHYEVIHLFNPLLNDSGLDTDSDGLSNLQEYQLGTDPNNNDSDNDTLLDGYENTNGLNPLDANDIHLDPDNDGLSNINEFNASTNPQIADTDGDGIHDGYEVAHGMNPLIASDGTLDADNDGLTNLQEFQLGSSATNTDTDADGIDDGFEVANGLNLLLSSDALLDMDGDGIANLYEYNLGTAINDPLSYPIQVPADLVPIHVGDILIFVPGFIDEDNDGINDKWELVFGLNPADNTDALLDSDSDGLNNLGEYQAKTSPLVADSDGDGYTDGFEVSMGLDPLGNADLQQDLDNDGYTSLEEINSGTHPTDIFSAPLRIDQIASNRPVQRDSLGRAVAIEGNTVVVSGGYLWEQQDYSGAIHVFEYQLNNTWKESIITLDNPDVSDNFGYSVAIENGRIFIGTHFINKIFIFEKDIHGNWQQTHQLTPPAGNPTGVGYSIAADGDRFITAGNTTYNAGIHIYERQVDDSWQHVYYHASYKIGADVSISGDIAVTNYQPGGNLHDATVLVFERDSNGIWSQTATVYSPYASTQATSRFASDIALDGHRLLVGDDRANITGMNDDIMTFTRNADASWQLEQEFFSGGTVFGEELALFGNRLAAVDFASLEIWERDSSQGWTLRETITFDGDLRKGVTMTDQRIVIGHDFNSNNNKTPNTRAVHVIDLRKALEEKDTDSDGMADLWESHYGLNLANASDSTLDNDGDSLTNLTEYQLGTDPLVVDTDGDLISDSYEANNNLNPLDASDAGADPDNDGLSNLDEFTLQTNPQSADTDNDGMADAYEVANGFDPLNNSDGSQDSDNDGFTNAEESQQNRNPFDPLDYPIVLTQRLEAPIAATGTKFGSGVVYSEVSQQIFVGAEEDNGTGIVTIYSNNNGQWVQAGQLSASDGQLQDRFGKNLVTSGNYLFVAAIADDDAGVDVGAVYVFEHQGAGVWAEQSKITYVDSQQYGYYLAASNEKLLVASNHRTRIDAYEFIAGQWLRTEIPLPAGLTGSGISGLDYENNRIVFSQSNWQNTNNQVVGAVYILEEEGSGNWQSYLLPNPNGNSTSETFSFGASIAVDGDWVIVGDSQAATHGLINAGAAYLYRKVANDWYLIESLTAADVTEKARYGAAVDIHNNRLLVGASGTGSNYELSGAFYVYDLQTNGDWKETKIQRDVGNSNELFAERLIEFGNTAVVSASWENLPAGNQGGASYIYAMPLVPTPVIEYFASQTTDIVEFDPLTLVWSVDPSTALSVSIEGVASNLPSTGSYQLTANSSQTQYTLVVDTASGQLRKTINLVVTAYPAPTIVLYTQADELKINNGQTVSVRAHVGYANQIRLLAANYEQIIPITFNRPIDFSGFIEAFVSPSLGTTYTLEATGPAGVTTRNFRVAVNLPQIDLLTPYTDLTVDLSVGNAYQVDWSVSNAYRVEAITAKYEGSSLVELQGPIDVALGSVPFTGVLSTGGNLQTSSVHHWLYAYNADNDMVFKNVVVNSVLVTNPPTLSLSNDPASLTINSGDVLTLNFAATNTNVLVVDGGGFHNKQFGAGAVNETLTAGFDVAPLVPTT